jgi:NAD(P)-dependent dehydrogenase (short-subunit alcohol dehydrogenase family)
MAQVLQGKVVLVTGGGSGIGRATSILLAKEGAKVMIADYVPEGAEHTVKMIKEAGGEANCIAADVSVASQVEMMVGKTVATYRRLDCAFNNAGVEGKMVDTAEYPEDVFDRIIAINLKGVWLCMKYEIPQNAEGWRRRDRQYSIGCGPGGGRPAFRVQCFEARRSWLD